MMMGRTTNHIADGNGKAVCGADGEAVHLLNIDKDTVCQGCVDVVNKILRERRGR